MPSQHVIICIQDGKIFFNDHLFLPIGRSNLPIEHLPVERIKNVFWEIEQLSFDKNAHILKARVSNYFVRETETFQQQSPKAAIDFIEFTGLVDVPSLKKCLLYSMTELPNLDRAVIEAFESINHPSLHDKPAEIKRKNLLFRSSPSHELINKEFSISFKDAAFKLGYVVFEHPVQETGELVRFKIRNDFLIPEFDLIKSYFMKALGTRKFNVSARITMENRKVVHAEATSRIISLINEELIDTIRNIRTLGITRPPFRGPIDKSLFTSSDIFDEFSADEREGNVFDQSEEEILKFLLEKSKVRNRKQLEYLAGQKQVPGSKLKFTLHPFFGFLFTIAGERMNHFVWELLNSHATYIWSIGKGDDELDLQVRRVEDAINQVRNSGREQYKLAWRTSPNDPDLIFNVIVHENVSSPFIEGFVMWRHRLNELIV
ncbi:MAG TPA: hypothetical protein PKH94_00150 [Bacteroidales bacterium]|nr:hypothetical protein [Bacteroidales bacterium]HNS45627.1 hypothetical protein [Bacteroidales bacterium]